MIPVVITRSIDGANGRNWPGFVIIDPDAKQPGAVAAQEIFESLHKLNPINLLRVRLSKSARRKMEYMGHEIEAQAAAMLYGDDPAARRAREAESMRRGYDGLFADLTVAQIAAAMAKNESDARAWVTDNRRKFSRFI